MRVIFVFLILAGVAFGSRDGGPYIGIGYGSSKYINDGLYDDMKSDTSQSATIYTGAYINKNFSVELGYSSFDAWQESQGYDVDDEKSVSFSTSTVSVLAHYAFFDDMLDFYAKGGVGQINGSGISTTGFDFVYGGGVGLRINEWFGLKMAYDRYDFEYKDKEDKKYNMYIDFVYGAVEFQF